MYSFDDIIGHEKLKEHLQTSIKLGKISHAYIFAGDEGVGKRLVSKIFAKTLQCEKNGINPCMSCKSCIQTDTNNQPDVKMIVKEKTNYAIDEIRKQVTNDVMIKPYAGPYKIYIIPDAHTLREDAQNALLKTIEEPPEYAIIILLVNNVSSLLSTILSRCVTLNFKPVKKDDVKQYLIKEYQIPDYAAEVSAVFSQGNIGRAIKYARTEEFVGIKEAAVRLARNLDKADAYQLMGQIIEVADLKDKITDYLDLLSFWFRDMLMCKATDDINTMIFKDEYGIIREQAKLREYKAIEDAINAISKAKSRLKANVNTEVVLEMMVLALKEKA